MKNFFRPDFLLPLYRAMEVAEAREYLEVFSIAQKVGRWRGWLTLKMREAPFITMVTAAFFWAVICISVFFVFRVLGSLRTDAAYCSQIVLLVLNWLLVARLQQMASVKKLALGHRWRVISKAYIENAGGVDAALLSLEDARKGLESRYRFGGSIVAILFGLVTSAVLSNEFVLAIITLNFRAAWNSSLVGTLSIAFLPLAWIFHIWTCAAPLNWIKEKI